MKQLAIALVATLAIGSAAAQAPAPQVFAADQAARPAVVVRADAGIVNIEDSAPLQVNASATAGPGDTVMVSKGSRATLTYADGCVVSIDESMQIAAVSPCKAGLVKGGKVGGWTQGQMLAAGFGVVVVGAAAVGGGGGSDRPSSP